MKRLTALALILALLTGCTSRAGNDGDLHILCTTYPIYLFTTAVVGNTQNVSVELLISQQTSCLHDYTLTVKDMKAIDRADIIVMNGAGLEDFLSNALEQKDIPVIDCSEEIYLFPTPEHMGHDGHDHEEEYDPHYWMDFLDAGQATTTISRELARLDPPNAQNYEENLSATIVELDRLYEYKYRFAPPAIPGGSEPPPERFPGLVTFHDGFFYFSSAFGLKLTRSIEEEEGSEASAQELAEIIQLVKNDHIPAIFVEKNGSRRSAEVIAQETGCEIYELDLLMSGDGTGIAPYIQAMEQNLKTVWEALG